MNWYKISGSEEWWEKAFYSKDSGYPDREYFYQCYWCGGFILPDGSVIYPPDFDISKYQEGEQIRDEVDKYIPVELKKMRTSHHCCQKCRPYFIEWRDRGF